MSKYTTELRFICETYAGLTESAGLSDVESIIKAARPKVFDFTYPIFDDAYRETLETKIIEHFYTQEIGFETVARWKLALRATMREIMPTYNRLYKDGLAILNPFNNIDITDTYTKTGSEERTSENTAHTSRAGDSREERSENGSNNGSITDAGSSSTTGSTEETTDGSTSKQSAAKNVHWDKYSDTPQGAISDIDNDRYLTSARKITDDGTGSTETITEDTTRTTESSSSTENDNTRSITGSDTREEKTQSNRSESADETATQTGQAQTTEEYVLNRIGRSGGDILDIAERMRNALVDVDQMIIADLQPLFMGLW